MNKATPNTAITLDDAHRLVGELFNQTKSLTSQVLKTNFGPDSVDKHLKISDLIMENTVLQRKARALHDILVGENTVGKVITKERAVMLKMGRLTHGYKSNQTEMMMNVINDLQASDIEYAIVHSNQGREIWRKGFIEPGDE